MTKLITYKNCQIVVYDSGAVFRFAVGVKFDSLEDFFEKQKEFYKHAKKGESFGDTWWYDSLDQAKKAIDKFKDNSAPITNTKNPKEKSKKDK
jgi:hypothetical protein